MKMKMKMKMDGQAQRDNKTIKFESMPVCINRHKFVPITPVDIMQMIRLLWCIVALCSRRCFSASLSKEAGCGDGNEVIQISSVMSELENLKLDCGHSDDLKAAIEQTVRIWENLRRSPTCDIPRFDSKDPSMQGLFKCQEEFYIAQALLCFSEYAFHQVDGSVDELITEKASIAEVLAEFFMKHKPEVMAEVAINMVLVEDVENAESLLDKYPQLALIESGGTTAFAELDRKDNEGKWPKRC